MVASLYHFLLRSVGQQAWLCLEIFCQSQDFCSYRKKECIGVKLFSGEIERLPKIPCSFETLLKLSHSRRSLLLSCLLNHDTTGMPS